MNVGIVVPCYNEEDVLPETARSLLALVERLIGQGAVAPESGIFFIDDGSKDRTWELIESLAQDSPVIHGIRLSRNKGHQKALVAGLENVPGEALITVDADLQDDIAVIETMIERFREGFDIVYGVRKSRDNDTWFKRNSAQAYYRILGLLGVEVLFNHADYRLMSRRAVDCLREFKEVNLFLRALVPLIGFKSTVVEYDRRSRQAGESKYPLIKMLGLALDGITSYSAIPLRMITLAGFFIFLVSTITGLWALWVRLFGATAVPGWASTVVPFYFLGGVQLLCIGVIGEYLAKIYMEVKARPRYFIDKHIGEHSRAHGHCDLRKEYSSVSYARTADDCKRP